MASGNSEHLLRSSSVKLLIAGGFGVGKTTMVDTISLAEHALAMITMGRPETVLNQAGDG